MRLISVLYIAFQILAVNTSFMKPSFASSANPCPSVAFCELLHFSISLPDYVPAELTLSEDRNRIFSPLFLLHLAPTSGIYSVLKTISRMNEWMNEWMNICAQ